MLGIFGQWARGLRPLRKTGANLWRRRVTRPYPRTAVAVRVQPALVYDEGHKCVACHLCESACPSDAIYIEAEPPADDSREKQPRHAELDLGRCLYCGLCIAACPEQALEFASRSHFGDPRRIDLVRGGAEAP